MDPCDGTEVLRVADRDVDPSTGLIATSRDASGLATHYRYDEMARLTSERPEADAWRHYRYHLPTATDPSLPRLTREVKIATGAAGQRTSVFTTEIYDAFGRLERVCEAQTSAWPGTCTGIETRYSYDESGNLTHVCADASATGCGQERIFLYDNRGLLTGKRQPEIGPIGNGWTYYTYDARGPTAMSTRPPA